jgi:hypothetical protein
MTILQYNKNIINLDVLLDQLQTAYPLLISNMISKDAILFIECSTEPTIEETDGIAKIIDDFNDEAFKEIELEKPVNLLATTKKFENTQHWTLVCKWQYQGRYIEALKKIILALSVVSNDPNGSLYLRLFDSTNNKVIASLEEQQIHNLQQSEIDITLETLSYIPSTLEIHVKSGSNEDIVTFHNITAISS